MRWVSSDQARTRYKFLLEQYEVSTTNIPKSTQQMIYYPTNKIRVPVNKQNVLKSGVVKPEDVDLIVDYIDIDLPTSGLYKNRLMMLDILHNNVGRSQGDRDTAAMDADVWDELMAMNLKGMFMTCKHVLPIMQEQGSGVILNISSISSICDGQTVTSKPSHGAVNTLTHQPILFHS